MFSVLPAVETAIRSILDVTKWDNNAVDDDGNEIIIDNKIDQIVGNSGIFFFAIIMYYYFKRNASM